MKIARYKKASKTLSFYKNNFGFRQPFQILIDATFCQAALHFQINIRDQIPKYFQSDTELVTTQCIILESESLGSKVQGATNIVKQFRVHKCGHEKEPKSATACIKTIVKKNRYIVASQDRGLQDRLREKPGQPMLYLHKKTPVLEQPSEISRKAVEFKMNEAITFGQSAVSKLDVLKKTQGLPAAEKVQPKKKAKKSQPNPLSCKKKKKKLVQTLETGKKVSEKGILNKAIDKKTRKRTHIPKHVKELLFKNNKD